MIILGGDQKNAAVDPLLQTHNSFHEMILKIRISKKYAKLVIMVCLMESLETREKTSISRPSVWLSLPLSPSLFASLPVLLTHADDDQKFPPVDDGDYR